MNINCLINEAKKSCMENSYSAILVYRNKIISISHNTHRYSRMFGKNSKSDILCSSKV
jgi:hypothetical protein